jgi:hypothetical protein
MERKFLMKVGGMAVKINSNNRRITDGVFFGLA